MTTRGRGEILGAEEARRIAVLTYQFVIPQPEREAHDFVLTKVATLLSRGWGYKVTADTGPSVTFTRKTTPTWAQILAVVGLLFFLLGLLFLLVKEEQILVLSLIPEGQHTKVIVSGDGPRRVPVVLAEKVPPLLSEAQAGSDLAQSTQAGWYPDPTQSNRLRWWDGAQWTDRYSDAAATPAGE